MRHVTEPLALALAGALFASGCATAHLKGEYNPDNLAPGASRDIVGKTDLHTIAEGNDFVFFWGMVEASSTNLGEKAKDKMRPGEVITDVEVRNHISLPGVLLWIVTAGIVSHHDLDLRGRIATVKPEERRPDRSVGMAPVERERTIIVGGAGDSGRRDGSGSSFAESDMFATSTIDRPLSEVSRDFRDAALKVGLLPLGDVAWNGLTPAERSEMRGEIPENRLEGVPLSNVKTFLVTNYALANDVKKDPQCGTFVPGLVCYEKDGKTNVIYSRFSNHLRQAETNGQVGEGKAMTRAKYEEHLGYANEFEASCRKLIDELQKRSSTRPSGT